MKLTVLTVRRRASDIRKMRAQGCSPETIRLLTVRLYTDVLIELARCPRSDYGPLCDAALEVQKEDL